MVFSSAVFLFLFLPVVVLLHTVIKNNNVRNGMLIAASLIFYAYGEPVCIVLLVGSVFVNLIFGNILTRNKNKAILALAVGLNLLLLIFYKYTGLVRMPIGISFFTFQAISYVVDVYRSEEKENVGFFDVLLYISLFPQLIAGPIVKFNSIKNQIKDRVVTLDGLTSGIRRFVTGLSKKMLIANTMAYVADTVFALATDSIGSGIAWFGAVCYTLQIFFDFSGYSDMALGLGSMMGFTFPENFDHPYIATSVRGFWRRWHMSLTAWFREYLYIPLGGNRKGKTRKILNTMIVFACTGIWHGANWTFLIWGIFHGIFMCVEELLSKGKKEEHFNILKWACTMLVVIVGFVIFRSDNIGYAVAYIGKMFSFTSAGGARLLLSMLTPVFIVTFIFALVACTPVVAFVSDRIKGKRIYNILNVISYAITFVLLFLCILGLAADSYNPFIYFRF